MGHINVAARSLECQRFHWDFFPSSGFPLGDRPLRPVGHGSCDPAAYPLPIGRPRSGASPRPAPRLAARPDLDQNVAAMATPPSILFVPRTGPDGLGEATRALVLARAASRRWPGARIEFVTITPGAWLEGRGFAHHRVEGGASRNPDGIDEVLRRTRPDVAIFDGWGRTSTLALARELGARTVFMAANDLALRRLFRSRRLRFVDQLWIVQSRLGATRPLLSRRWRLRLALSRRPALHVFDAIFPEPDPIRAKDLRRTIGLPDDRYALLCAGGGGTVHAGRPVPEIFAEAAGRVREETGMATVLVQGPLYEGDAPPPPGVLVVKSLEPEQMIDLLAGAEVIACGGGDIIAQALANERPCVAADAGGLDQPDRIRGFAEAGLIEASPLDACELADRMSRLARDADHRGALGERVAASGLRNRVTDALDCLEPLLAPPATA